MIGKEIIHDKKHLIQYFYRAYPTGFTKPDNAELIIVLASGKCGTLSTTHLMNLSADIFSTHELNPRLFHLGDRVYKDDCQNPMWGEIYWAARRDILSIVNEHGLIFFDGNHRISVFLPAIKKMFSKAKFILLWRDFDETVISMARWGCYGHLDKTAEGRIRPYPEDGIDDMRLACAWHWCVFYEYILRHIQDIDVIPIHFEWLEQQEIVKLQSVFEKLGVQVPDKSLIQGTLDKKHNATKPKNLFDVPKIWQHFDDRAQEITQQLMKI